MEIVGLPMWAWILFYVLVFIMLFIDLKSFGKKGQHEVGVSEALKMTAVWIGVSLVFCGGIYLWYPGDSHEKAMEFLAGYLIEKSLSMDNLFVFLMLFSFFGVKNKYQHEVLFWGIFGALVLRSIFIFAGTAIISQFEWVLAVFGVFLIYTGIKMFGHKDEEQVDPSKNIFVKLFKKFFPVTDQMHEDKFFVVADELIEVMSTNPKICRYIDIPIQSGSDNVLMKMGRRTRQDEIRQTVKRLRDAMPDICLRTTLIAGFPGESEEDYEETYRFINEMEFDRLGVFMYSPEEGTRAYDFRPKVDDEEKKRRRDELYELQQAISYELSQKLVGKTMRVIVDGFLPDDGVYVARSYRDAPDIDGLVFVYSDRELITGDMIDVRITDAKEYDLEGVMIDESSE